MNSLFNRDIKRAFKEVDVNPTEAFKAKLHARLSAETTSAVAPRPVPIFRMFALAGATLAIVLGVQQLTFGPMSTHEVFAKAIQDTFAFKPTGYHHLKLSVSTYDPARDGLWTDSLETWTDGVRAIFDADGRGYGIGGAHTSEYFDGEQGVHCNYAVDQQPITCDTADVGLSPLTNERPETTDNLVIHDLQITAIDTSVADTKLTWTTNQPLQFGLIKQSLGAYAYGVLTLSVDSIPSDTPGEYRYQSTWVTDNLRTSSDPIDAYDNFYIQIMDIGTAEAYGMNSYVGTPDAQSQVYRLDTVSKTVTAVEDSELQTSRKAYTQNFIAQAASPERIQEQYESAFTSLLEIANRLDTYQDVSTTTGEQDGRRLQYVIYNLSNQGPVLIDPNVISANGIAASKAEFARDIESNLILWAKLYDNQGQLIYHVEVQAFDEQPTAPENILTLEAWKAHTATLK